MSTPDIEIPDDAGEWADDLRDLLSRFTSGYVGRIYCGRGWYPLICKTNRQLRFIAPDYSVFQIKEKFGTLRFYAEMPPPSPEVTEEEHDIRRGIFEAIIERAENMSDHVCEICGKYGRLMVPRQGSWIRTLCSSCAVEQDYIESTLD